MAASEARKLRRVIKEYVNAVEIRHPEIKQFKPTIIKEFYGEDLVKQNPPDFEHTPWTGAINLKREPVLIHLGAEPFDSGINPDGFQLTVRVKDPSGRTNVVKKDRLWFYDNGTVWSTNQIRTLYYKSTPDNKIQLYTTSDDRDSGNLEYKVGDIEKKDGVAYYNIITDVEEKPLTTWEKTKDILHTTLDLAGWIPGYGDIADVINCIWYYAEGEYFEAVLSGIAIIPIIGSAVKTTVKGAMLAVKTTSKGFVKLVKRSLKFPTNIADNYKIWDELMKTGKLSKADLELIGPGLDTLSGIFKRASDASKGLPGGDSIAKQLDDFSEWMAQSSKNLDELAKLGADSAAAAAKSGATINKTIAKGTDAAIDASRKLVSYIPAVKAEGLFKRLRGLAWFPEKKLMQIAKGMEKRFMKNMAHPDKLMALMKTMPGADQVLKNGVANIKGFQPLLKKHMPNLFNRSGRMVGNADDLLRNSRNSKQLQSLFREISSDPGMWREITDDIAKHAISNNSPIWNLYKTDALKALATTLDYRYMKGFWDTSFAKNADVIYNELQDMGEDITQEMRDNPTGVIYPVIKAGLNAVLPGDTIKNVQSFRDKVAENPITKIALSAAGYSVKDDGSITKTRNLNYDPFGEAGGDRI